MAEVIFNLARRENGRYVAASTASPYFCFEADTEESVIQKAEAAIAFYGEAKSALRALRKPEQETKITVTRVRSFSRVRRPLLEVA
jgi:predicted RNase H-like HicB family nuclease